MTPSEFLEANIEGLEIQPNQKAFLDDGEWPFAGLRGSGQTFAILLKCVYNALTDPGCDVVRFRSSAHLSHALHIFRRFRMKDKAQAWKYNTTCRFFAFPCGGRIHLSFIDDHQDKFCGFENVRFHDDI
jgi:hypothetical protein